MNKGAKRLLCLVNPRSGGNKGAEVARLLSTLSISSIDKIEVRLLDINSELPAADLIERDFSAVLIAGGDGTFSSVLGHYSDAKIDFLLLPLGTGNDLGKELGISKLWRGNLQKFINLSLTLAPKKIQVWQATLLVDSEIKRVKFLNYLSIGWDGLIVKEFDRMRSKNVFPSGKFGPWGNRFLYLIAALKNPHYQLPPTIVVADPGETTEISNSKSLIFSNITSIMGVGKSNSIGDCSDELIEICIINKALDYFKMILPKTLTSSAAPIQGKCFKLKFIDTTHAIPVQIDGEYFGQSGSIEIATAGTVSVRFSNN